MAVDPLWEKYRAFNTYQYAANNPLVLSDPTGLEIDWVGSEEQKEYMKQKYIESMMEFYKRGAYEAYEMLFDALTNPNYRLQVIYTDEFPSDENKVNSFASAYDDWEINSRGTGYDGTITFNPHIGQEVGGFTSDKMEEYLVNGIMPVAGTLSHEVGHANEFIYNYSNYRRGSHTVNGKFIPYDQPMPPSFTSNYSNGEEERQIREDNKVGHQMGWKYDMSKPLRTSHSGVPCYIDPRKTSIP